MQRFLMGLVLLSQILLTSPLQGQCSDPRNDFSCVHPYANLKLGVNLIPLSKAKSGTHLNISASLGLMLPKEYIQPNLLFTATFLRGDIGTSIIPVGKPDIRFEGMLTIAASWSGNNPVLEDQFTTMGRTFHVGSSAMLWLPHTK
ncbi:MAG: hypothetical protein KDC44_13400, partial [Phaeodactylibacter sp.]|nr:hypothetical protein [Phaeodactylibacter sp.]